MATASILKKKIEKSPYVSIGFVIGHAISAIRGLCLLIFALDKLNVRHISTSALDDLLT